VRNRDKIAQLELELFKLRVELDLMHEVIHGFIQSQEQKVQNMDSGKWYPRRLPPQN
jgi:hypothetical protein